MRMITFSRTSTIMLGMMTPLTAPHRLLLVADRRAPGAMPLASPVRRYRLARLHADRPRPVVIPVHKSP
ncbi:MAG: hypothetical protein ACR2NR_17890 [Solirubrobacteraceae bacterium]